MKGLAAAALMIAVALLAATAAPGGRSAPSADCSRTSVGLTALPDLRSRRYKGFQGGLYAGGKNVPPAGYLKQGLAAARQIKPIGGRIVLLSVGMSNTTQEYQAFKRLADADPRKSPNVLVVDGAQGGQDAEAIKEVSARFWSVIDERLAAAGASAAQVQAAWLKEAIARPTEAFPADARRLQADLRAIVGIMKARYPNLRIVFLSSRTYGGYASTALNPEPYAYQSGFAVKWTVGERVAGRLKGRPWLAWGPYLWTDGTRGRKDGFRWACSDTRTDGTHPSESGRRKVAELLLRFFETNRTAKSWFVAR